MFFISLTTLNTTLAFLVDNRNFSPQHLNTLLSSIASVFSIIHSNEIPIAKQPLIKDFFTSKRKTNITIPTTQQLQTWDIEILVEYIKTKLSPTSSLSLKQIQLKTVLLLCIGTMWRPRSDIGRLQHRDVLIKDENTESMHLYLHARMPKESTVKTSKLGLMLEEELCPVRTTYRFLEKTKHLRCTLPEDHSLFLTYLDCEDKISNSVRPSTVANWINTAMEEAGIYTSEYNAHSIRAASSTNAVEKGHSIQSVKKHAHWSLNSNTFEDYYYKPHTQSADSTLINSSIFCTEKSITSEVGMESTGICLGTTTHTYVDETKTEDVIHTRPWYRFFG